MRCNIGYMLELCQLAMHLKDFTVWNLYLAMTEHESQISIEIYTMTGEQNVMAWARQCIISQEAIETLASDGFTSMEAIQLLDTHDMKR